MIAAKVAEPAPAPAVTTERFYLPQLDGLRLGAFALVFLHHAPPFPASRFVSRLQEIGWSGVDLFFVLSAYLLATLLDRERHATGTVDVKAFFIRRVLRIWPLFFVYVGACFLYFLVTDGADLDRIGPRTLGHLLFLDNVFTAVARDYNPLNFTQHLWTVAFEEQVYLIMPLLVAATLWLRRHPAMFAAAVVIVTASQPLLRLRFADNRFALWALPVLHFEAVLAGLVLASGVLARLAARVSADLLAVAGVVTLVVVAREPPADAYVFMPVALAFLLIVLGSLDSRSLGARLLSRPTAVFLGRISYGLYVWHWTGYEFARRLAASVAVPEHTLVAWLVVVIPAFAWTLGLSLVSYFVLERPFLRLKDRFTVVPNRTA